MFRNSIIVRERLLRAGHLSHDSPEGGGRGGGGSSFPSHPSKGVERGESKTNPLGLFREGKGESAFFAIPLPGGRGRERGEGQAGARRNNFLASQQLMQTLLRSNGNPHLT